MPQILVLEPYPALRQALAMLLQRAEWHVTAVPTTRATRQALAQDAHDVVLVDLDNAGSAGWNILRALQDRPTPVSLVALLSPDSRSWPDAGAQGPLALVPTPVRREVLLTAVREALTSAQHRQEHA